MGITRKVAASVAIGAMAASLAACSGGGENASGGDGKNITIFAFQNEKVMNPIIAAFEQANPGVKVTATFNSGTGGDYAKTLQTRIAGKQTPTIFNFVGENRAEVMQNKLAADLSDLAVIKTVDPSWLDAYRDDNGVYGMSYSAWMGGIIYNKDLLAQAGVNEFPESWEDFLKAGEALLAKKIKPYYEEQKIASGSLTAMLASSYKASGSPSADWVFNARPEGKTFAESWTPVLAEWKKAIDAGVFPKETIGLDGAGIKSAFLNKEVAMYRSGTWDRGDVEAAGINYGFAAFPAFPGGETFINGGPQPAYAIAASAGDAEKATARKFLEFLGSEEGVKLQTTAQQDMSISSAFATEAGPAFAKAYSDNLQKGLKYWFEWTKGSAPMTTTITAQQQQMFQGESTPESFAKALDEEFGKL